MSVMVEEGPDRDRPEWAKRENSPVLGTYKYIAELIDGCIVTGETRAPEIIEMMGAHGAVCEHGWMEFYDLVSTKPLTDKWGRT